MHWLAPEKFHFVLMTPFEISMFWPLLAKNLKIGFFLKKIIQVNFQTLRCCNLKQKIRKIPWFFMWLEKPYFRAILGLLGSTKRFFSKKSGCATFSLFPSSDSKKTSVQTDKHAKGISWNLQVVGSKRILVIRIFSLTINIKFLPTFWLRKKFVDLTYSTKSFEVYKKISECFYPWTLDLTLNIHKTFTRYPGHLLNILGTSNFCLVSVRRKLTIGPIGHIEHI